ncbi:PKD domain-containing protein, partial [Reichenbachiella ulvae]
TGASSIDNITIVVNQAPVALISKETETIKTGESVELDGSGSSDPDGTITSYAWTISSGPSIPTIDDADKSNASVSIDTPGIYTITLEVTDNFGLSSTDLITITVENRAPIALISKESESINIGEQVTLDGTGSSDPDGTVASYLWTVSSGPSTPSIQDAGNALASTTIDIPGEYVISLEVTDDLGASSIDLITLIVGNKSPIAIISTDSQNLQVGETLTLDGSTSSDPDGTISSYLWIVSSGPTTPTIENSDKATASVKFDQVGEYVITLEIIDNLGSSATDNISILVENSAPIALISEEKVTMMAGETIELDGSQSTDSDGSIAEYKWSISSGPAKPYIKQADQAIATISIDVPGEYVITLEVTDNTGNSSSDDILITVEALPIQPLSVDDQTINPQIILNLYPNPSIQGIVNLNLNIETGETVTLEIFTLDGKSVFYQQLQYEENNTHLDLSKDISNMKSQLVILLVKTNQEYDTERLIIK